MSTKFNRIFLSFFLMPFTSTAQDADTTSHGIKSLDDITLSATRFPEKRKYLSQELVLLTEKKIAALNQPTTAELLQHSGNVSVQKSQGGGGSPVIRGFEANKILIVVDGVRMNNAIFRGGHLQNIITIDPEIVDQLEILYGPSSVMYGSDALGGYYIFFQKNLFFHQIKKQYLMPGC